VATPSGGTAALAPGIGQASTRGGRLAITAGCQSPTLANNVSFPWRSTANLAVAIAVRGTAAKELNVGDGNTNGPNPTWYVLTGDGGNFATHNLCVPEYVKGMVHPMRLTLSSTPGGSCPTPEAAEFVVDNLRFVTEASCPANAAILDGGFEKTSNVVSYWPVSLSQNGTTGKVSATILNSPADARTGNRVLRLTVAQDCTSATASTIVTVPEPVGNAGPAVKFYYKASANGGGGFATNPGTALPLAAAYTQRIVCLDPSQAGRGISFEVRSQGTGGLCSTQYPAATGFFDDFEVTTDPSCPAF
jgi:hypothetical protein